MLCAYCHSAQRLNSSAETRRFEEKRKDARHRQRLTDDSPGGAGKLGPVGAELEFHGNAGHHAERKIDAENFPPEARGAVVVAVVGAQCYGFQDDNQESEPHGELRKQIMERDGESELKAVDGESIVQADSLPERTDPSLPPRDILT